MAVQAARTSPGQIATLILPSDTSWDEGGVVGEPLPVPAAPTSAPSQIDEAAAILRRGGAGVLLLLSGPGLSEEGLAYAHRIAAHTGCRLMAGGSNARTARGQGRIPVDRVPYVVDVAVKALAGTKHLILAGAKRPVSLCLSGQGADLGAAGRRPARAGTAGTGHRRCAGTAGRSGGCAEGGEAG